METLTSLIESLVSPNLNSLAGNSLQRVLIAQQLQHIFEDGQINLADLQSHGLLTKLAAMVSHKVVHWPRTSTLLTHTAIAQ